MLKKFSRITIQFSTTKTGMEEQAIILSIECFTMAHLPHGPDSVRESIGNALSESAAIRKLGFPDKYFPCSP